MNSGGSNNVSLKYERYGIIWLLRFRYYKIGICGKNSILIHVRKTKTRVAHTKELSFCHKLWFSNHYIFATKCWILLDQIIWVWNIKGFQHWVLKILRFKYLILFQKLNSLVPMMSYKLYLLCIVRLFDFTKR